MRERGAVRRWTGSGVAIAVAMALLTGPAGAAVRPDAAAEPPELATDRPDFTETAIVVPQGSLQLESGFTYAEEGGVCELSGPEMLLRLGVARRTELRVGVPDYVLVRGQERASGIGDPSLGFKQQFGPLGTFDLALIAAVSLPTGSSQVTSDGFDPIAVLGWSQDLSELYSLGGIAGGAWITEGDRHRLSGLVTVALGRSLGERWGMFLEYAAELPEGEPSSQLIHQGFTYAITPASQADLHFGAGITNSAPDFFIGAGYSARFGPRAPKKEKDADTATAAKPVWRAGSRAARMRSEK